MNWISVKDRLPDRDGKCLVSARTADPDLPYIATAWYHPEESRWSLFPTVFIPSISHWIEITPPKE